MKELVLSHPQILAICKDLGAKLTEDLKDEKRRPMIIGVMKGAINFMMDLLPEIHVPVFTEYVQITSWEGTECTGKYTIGRDLNADVEDRTIVLVEDIVDTGLTLTHFIEHIKEKHHPKRILICSLIDRPIARKVELKVDYPGYTMPERKFLVGYGLDYLEMVRNEDFIYVPSDSDLEEWDRLKKQDDER